LVMGITSDFLCPVYEQKFIAENMPNATYVEIDSSYGHDGFLIEYEKISSHLTKWIGQL
jgi:homoserine O-acetyltransferase